jgi:hypothetical protein
MNLVHAITRDGQVVGLPTHDVDITEREYVVFDEINAAVTNLSDVLDYRGGHFVVCHIMTVVGLLVDFRGAHGPLCQGVLCRVVR